MPRVRALISREARDSTLLILTEPQQRSVFRHSQNPQAVRQAWTLALAVRQALAPHTLDHNPHTQNNTPVHSPIDNPHCHNRCPPHAQIHLGYPHCTVIWFIKISSLSPCILLP